MLMGEPVEGGIMSSVREEGKSDLVGRREIIFVRSPSTSNEGTGQSRGSLFDIDGWQNLGFNQSSSKAIILMLL